MVGRLLDRLNLDSSRDFVAYGHWGLFLLRFWAIHLVIISIYSAIHFWLNHDLQVTENWIYDRAWPIVSLSYLLATLYSALSIINNYWNGEWKSVLKLWDWGHYKRRSLVFILYNYFFFYTLFSPWHLKDSIEWSWLIGSFIGVFILLGGFIFLLLLWTHTFFKMPSWQRVVFLLFAVGSFILNFEITILYKLESVWPFYSLLFVISCFFWFNNFIWNIAQVFALAVVLPVTILLGFDPIYAGSSSLLSIDSSTSLFAMCLVEVVGFLYVVQDQLKLYLNRKESI